MSRPAPTLPRDTGGRLAAEWSRLRTRASVLRHAAAWGLVDEPLRDLEQVLAAVGFRRRQTGETERRLRRLVLTAADDDLAARVVVERVLPGLLAVVARRRPAHGPDTFDELLGAAWLSIRTFDPARRPSCLAAAIISDADYRAFRAPRRRRDAETVPVPTVVIAQPVTDPDPLQELAQLFRDARAAGVPHADLELLRQLLAAPTTDDLARRLRVTPRTIRNRRARITDRLRVVARAA